MLKEKEVSERKEHHSEKDNGKIVPDTSIIISGVLSDLISRGDVGGEIIIPEFVLEELRAQASRGRQIGFRGLEEVKKIRELAGENKVILRKSGRRQTYEEIKLAKYGRIDALILDVAREENAVIYTSDMVQAMVAEAEGIATRYFKPYEKERKIRLMEFLTPDTMSLHLKEKCIPLAKRGKPGNMKLVKVSSEPLTTEEIEQMCSEIMDAVRYEEDAFLEIGAHGASVVQIGDKRIAITRPPFSDGIEVTVVRPIVKLTLDEYKISRKLLERMEKAAEGILIAGPPGSGKSTFAASVAEFYEKRGKIVKTMESPRDLQVPPEITQYTKLDGSFANTADMLLLVRPDYTIFDEVRKTEEFRIFSDMRLAGIGMIGVVHASNPIDAVQRFIGRIELGMIPHVIDTIIFIRNGEIEEIFDLVLTVRVPTGMTEADLARPIVEVRRFEDGKLEFEIYSYGEENVIIPIKEAQYESAVRKLARQQILVEVRKFDRHADVEITADNKAAVRVDNDVIPKIIGKQGRTIKELEEKLGISIEVLPKVTTLGKETTFEKTETGAYLVFKLPEKLSGQIANFYVADTYLFSATIGKEGTIRVSKDSETGRDVMKAIIKGNLKIFV
jgi:ATPase